MAFKRSGVRLPLAPPVNLGDSGLETDPDKADFLIATERMRCGEGRPVVLIDEVKRFDRPFAWTYARATEEAPRPAAAGHQGQLPSRPHAE